MNQDITRSALTRLVIVGVLAGGGSFLLVKPKTSEASDLRKEFEQREMYIQKGESNIAMHQDEISRLVESTLRSRDAMLEDLSPDSHLQDQQIFQRMAAARGLTITRVEPIRESSNSAKVGEFGAEASLLTKEFRIECRGAFSGLVAFIDDIQTSKRQMQVKDFRLVPTDAQRIRTSLTISMVELAMYPEALNQVFSSNTQVDASETQDLTTDGGES